MKNHERWSSEVRIVISYIGRSSDNRARYSGAVWVTVDGREIRVKFKDVRSGCGGVSSGEGFGYEDEDDQAFDAMAEAVLDFYSFYSSDNRPSDPAELPGWAPKPKVCDAIRNEAEHGEREGFTIKRERGGPIAFTNGRHTQEFRLPRRMQEAWL